MTSFILIALLLLAGVFQASFALPMAHFRKWRWEHVWVGQAIFSNLVLPGLVLLFALSEFMPDLRNFTSSQWLVLGMLGVAWGVGGVGYGLSLVLLGFSFTYSIVFSVTTLAGSILPLALGWSAPPLRPWWFISGLGFCIGGTLALAKAGARRESEQGSERAGSKQLSVPVPALPYALTLVLALVAGIFSSGLGLALAWGGGLVKEMIKGGVSPVVAPLAVWIPAFLGSAVVAIGYGLWCSRRSRSLPAFWRSAPTWNWSLVGAMGLLGFGGMALYGIGASASGHPRETVAWGIYMSSFILSGNVLGIMTREWRSCSRRTYSVFTGGVALLLAAIVSLARA